MNSNLHKFVIMKRIYQVGNAKLELKYEINKLPDIAGVRIPSPITIQEPTRTRISIVFFMNACRSSHLLVLAANECSEKIERL